jgi:hypothetical protein
VVRDESAFPVNEKDVFEGTSFRRFQKSRLLKFIEQTAYSEDVRPSPLFHYGIYCLDDLVDVVAPTAPEIRFIGMTAR